MRPLLLTFALLLSGCAAKFYDPATGHQIASVPWPQQGTLSAPGVQMSVQPGAGTVEATQATVLGLAQQAPGIAVAVINQYQKTQGE